MTRAVRAELEALAAWLGLADLDLAADGNLVARA
jgi:hypothetical protein